MKKVWIFNHYATSTFFDHGGRHYYFAKYLIRAGYDVKIFCASTVHNTEKNLITDSRTYFEDSCDGIPYIFIKCRNYIGNGKERVFNMFDYYHGLLKITKNYEKPNVIIGSSVHPLACIAANKLAKKYKCKSIVEIRDLWPESFVAFGIMKKTNSLISCLYAGEKWIYKNANAIIFTMEGGKDYIIEKNWDKANGGPIDLNKVYHINNGVDLEEFETNRQKDDFHDNDLENSKLFKVVYTGSVRFVNQVSELVNVAKILRDKHADNIKILIWGAGDQCDEISRNIKAEGLTNIIIKGSVPKNTIPQILLKSDLNIYLLAQSPLYKYGLSLNKQFEYFVSGKPVLASSNSGYSIIDNYHCGVCLENFTSEAMALEIIRFSNMSYDEYMKYCEKAKCAAKNYDYKELTHRLLEVIKG